MKVLSLDQCFLRNLLRPPTGDTKFDSLKKTLETAVDAGKVICPAHDREMIYESVLLPDAQRDAIISLQNRLSGAFVFRSFYDVLALETLKLVRPMDDYFPYQFGKVRLKANADLKSLADEIRSSKKAAINKADSISYPPKAYVMGSDLKTVYAAVTKARCASMFRIVEALLKTGRMDTRLPEWDVAEGVAESLIQMRVTRIELASLADKIITRVWERILVLKCHTLLFTHIERDMVETGRKFDINDHPDIFRLSVALVHADAAGYDTKMKESVKQTGLKDLACTVFSIREPDALQAFVESL